uniref:Magnesium transporter n=1 Tax=Meloidogyne hapla TaxID=6305 RepID=A0A1I8BFZ5_MELHA
IDMCFAIICSITFVVEHSNETGRNSSILGVFNVFGIGIIILCFHISGSVEVIKE